MFNKSFRVLFLLFIFCPAFPLFAQTYTSLKQAEDSLKSIARLIKESPSDSARKILNDHFLVSLNEAIRIPGSFDYAFDSVRILGKLKSPDRRFRIYNWNLPRSDGSNISFGLIQVNNKIKGQFDYFDLNDRSDSIEQPETQVLDGRHWYGSLYYRIIENSSVTDHKKYYTLLGWIARNRFYTEKIIEVLTFDDEGIPVLGAGIFRNFGDGQNRRVIFRYSVTAKMALNYNEMELPTAPESVQLLKHYGIEGKKAKMIICDHLVPLDPQMEKQYQYYVPAADTYDAFIFSKEGWVFLKEVNARNSPNPSKRRL
jgi:hypothetical protein